jgi:hypothetical protein
MQVVHADEREKIPAHPLFVRYFQSFCEHSDFDTCSLSDRPAREIENVG